MQSLLILSGHGSGTTEDFLMKDEASLDALTSMSWRRAQVVSGTNTEQRD